MNIHYNIYNLNFKIGEYTLRSSGYNGEEILFNKEEGYDEKKK